MIKASGAIFMSSSTGRICLFLRSQTVSHSNTWGFVGGKINNDETIINGLVREINEEMGFMPKYKSIIPIDVFQSVDLNFKYYSVVIVVENEFCPILNNENSGYGWFDFNVLPKPLHSGANSLLNKSTVKSILVDIRKDFTS